MRSEKELWELVLSRTDLFRTGLCYWIKALQDVAKLSSEEYWGLRKILIGNLPKKTPKSHYRWPPFKIEPRIEWIKNRIKQLENEKA